MKIKRYFNSESLILTGVIILIFLFLAIEISKIEKEITNLENEMDNINFLIEESNKKL